MKNGFHHLLVITHRSSRERGHHRDNRPQRSAIMPLPTSHQHTRSPLLRTRGRGLRAIGAIVAVVALAPALTACNDAATSATATPVRPVPRQGVAIAPPHETGSFASVVRAGS